ncbi:MAG: acyltransferase [Leptospirales bacterium]|nr:acyltransferase [Leptospirales bacterium]
MRDFLLSLFLRREGERSELDGLRAWAILPVLLYHFWLAARFAAPPLPEWLATGLLHSYSGVSLFFTLSGYLITSILLRENGPQTWAGIGSFWAQRALRILPALYAYLAITLWISWQRLAALEVHGLQAAPEYLALSASVQRWPLDFLLVSNYRETFQPHVWSLCVEQHFYLLFPALLWILRGHPKQTALAAGALYLLPGILRMGRALAGDAVAFQEAIYHQTQFRFDDIMVGVLLAAAMRGFQLSAWLHRWRAEWSMPALAAALLIPGHVLALEENLYFQALRYNLINLGYGALLLGALTLRGPLCALLSLPFWRPLARLSYSMYLWHFFAGARAMGGLSERILSGEFIAPAELARSFASSAGLTGLYALASYYFIEQPFLLLRRRLTRRAAPIA